MNSDQIVAEHDALAKIRIEKGTALSRVLMIEYRCPAGCLLMHAWRATDGVRWYRPPHTLSHETAANEITEAARIKRTSDGERKWVATGGSLDDLLDFFDFDPTGGGLSMNCHHLRNITVLCDRLAADSNVTPGQPTRATITP